MNNCIYCGAPLDDDSLFCANCGKKIEPQSKWCPRCGTKAELDSLFCAKCGMRLDLHITQTVNFQQPVSSVSPIQEEEDYLESQEEQDRTWWYIIGGLMIVALLVICWYGYTKHNEPVQKDIMELLDNLQLPKEYYHSAKEVIEEPGFDLKYYQSGNEYALRGRIVYNQKYGKEIQFVNKTFNSDKDDIDGFYWVVGHVMDCWNTSPALAIYTTERDGSFDWVTWESSFYYSSSTTSGVQFVMINDYDNKDNLIFQSKDGKYKAKFKQVHIN